jgi:membrane protein
MEVLPIIKEMTKAYRKKTVRALPKMLKEAFVELSKNDPLRMAGATAFFTSFALPPILIILIQVLGLVFNKRKISRSLFEGLAGTIEKESMHQVVSTLHAFHKLADNWFVTIGGFIFLLFVATTLFKVIKDSINQLWQIRVIKTRNLGLNIRGRLRSFIIIVMGGLLLIPGIFLTGEQTFLEKYLTDISPALAFYFSSGLNHLVSIIVVTSWFTIMFRYLPDGKPAWSVALVGAFLTSLLFNMGKFILHRVLSHSNIQEFYGSSGSVVILLLFVFYSALILYYGVCFTKIWAAWVVMPIKPLHHAIQYKISEIRDEKDS